MIVADTGESELLPVSTMMIDTHAPLELSETMACPDCDSLFRVGTLVEAQRVDCPYCGARLCEHKKDALSRSTAFALSALVLFFVAHFFPFLSLQVGSRGNEIALLSSVGELYDNGSPWLGFMVALFIVAAPALIIAGILYVLAPLFWGRVLPGAPRVCRWVFDAGPWNMIEIFMLGVLVSLMKLTKLASVHLGLSFWAFALLILCVTASFGAIDRAELWRRLEMAGALSR